MKRTLALLSLIAVAVVTLLSAACGAPGATGPAATQNAEKPAAAAWQQKWDSTVAEAKKEGKIVLYGQVGPELRDALISNLRQEFGLDVEVVTGKGNEVAPRFIAETNAGTPSADFLVGGSTTFLNDPKLADAWAPMEPMLILPEVLDSKAWPNGQLPFIDSQHRLIPLVLEVNQLLEINSDSIKPGTITANKQLIDPQWKGKIVMYDPTVAGTANTWVNLILNKWYGQAEGEAFLRKYVEQEPMITKDSRQQIEWLARGRYPINVAVDTQAAYSMQKAGAPIVRVVMEEGGLLTGGGSYIGISVKRTHPAATTVVLNWLLSVKGQEIFSKNYGAPAARLGIKTEGVSPLALAQPGEKLLVVDEAFVNTAPAARETAKKIFAPLLR